MSIKQDRVANRIQIILSELFRREVSDPRLQGLTVTKVEIDPELMFARISVNALGEEDRQDDVMQGLQRANGFLSREVGKRVRLRNTPELHFFWDASLERSERMQRLLESLEIPEETDDDDTME